MVSGEGEIVLHELQLGIVGLPGGIGFDVNLVFGRHEAHEAEPTVVVLAAEKLIDGVTVVAGTGEEAAVRG